MGYAEGIVVLIMITTLIIQYLLSFIDLQEHITSLNPIIIAFAEGCLLESEELEYNSYAYKYRKDHGTDQIFDIIIRIDKDHYSYNYSNGRKERLRYISHEIDNLWIPSRYFDPPLAWFW